ncbi:crotonase/enoyl-CoA hydratase family protein [Granulicoccus phenolivorans]|uniref:crotonase/enoyl-CoA hydratase family protein n=1 Tax=Granulicoccus phenolivorans TaxID=266854 RepID=UPI00041CBB75|nr:crotonase/enoyl-CoA hydratase family protein [Granulicoccus phenolivorans]
MSDEVLVDKRDGVMVITINRPEKKNALNAAVGQGVSDAIDELEATEGLWAGVLTGAGGIFSAGMDLKAFLAGETPNVGDRGMCGITRRPPTKPVIAAVEGWALAGGMELTLACDLIVAARTAKFGVPEVKRGLVARGGALLQLPRRIPQALALEMLLTGDPVTAEKAAEIGLINRLTEEGGALEAAVELAQKIAENGPMAVAATRQILREQQDWTLAERWQRQGEIADPVFASADAKEGATAFTEKRKPVWQGR